MRTSFRLTIACCTTSSSHGLGCAGIEDRAIFPALAARMDVSGLQQDHKEMETVIHDIREACRTHGELGGHLAELRELVFPHMLLEEEQTRAAKLRAAGFTPQEMHNMG